MTSFTPLTDLEWGALSELFQAPPKRGRGKPHTPWRAVVNSILFIVTTGGKWGLLPKSELYASKSAANRWFREWDQSGFLNTLLNAYQECKGVSSVLYCPPRRQRGPSAKELSVEPVLIA
jgi:transposase